MAANQDQDFERLVRQEELILDVTDAMTRALEQTGVSKGELANRLGRSKGFVSQVFGGGRNLTLRTISDIAYALSLRPRISLCHEHDQEFYTETIEWKPRPKVIRHPSSYAATEQRLCSAVG